MFTQPPYLKFIDLCSPNFPFINEASYNRILKLKDNAEVCGVIRDGEFIELYNHSKHYETALIDMSDIKEDDILFHTHTSQQSTPLFSKRDMLTGKRNKLSMLLYHTYFKIFDYWTPAIPHPYPLKLKAFKIELEHYLNLPYQWVRSDCYSFCKDVAEGIYKKRLPEIYNRKQSLATLKYFFSHPEELGFKPIFSFKEGCFVLLRMSVNIPYHMGIITKVYDNNNVMMIHQLGEGTNSNLINLNDYMGNIINIYDFDYDKLTSTHFTPIIEPLRF